VNSPSPGLTIFTYRATVSAGTTQAITHIYFSLCPPILDRTVPLNLDNSWSALSSSANTLDDTQWTGYRRAVTIPAGAVLDSVFNVTNPFVLAPISVILRFANNEFYVATVLGPVINSCTGKICIMNHVPIVYTVCFQPNLRMQPCPKGAEVEHFEPLISIFIGTRRLPLAYALVL